MSDRTRAPKIPGFDRAILDDNVLRLIQHHFPTVRNKTRRLAEDAQIAHSSVQRACKGEVGCGLDTIEAIARAFDLSAYQLLIPELDPANPQSIPGALQAERRLYRRWQTKKQEEQQQQQQS